MSMSIGFVVRFLIFLILGGLGIKMYLHPAAVSEKIYWFYKDQPLYRLAGGKQYKARDGFIKVFGAVIIVLGILIMLPFG